PRLAGTPQEGNKTHQLNQIRHCEAGNERAKAISPFRSEKSASKQISLLYLRKCNPYKNA
ncbi:hypothetical protein, partial [Pedobacter fastidiosus]|uniref:hypothetical protein n=1 Tax=Pedobacter fastidiosus TaxID=2765361 RepID=UPI001C9A83D5